MIGTRNRGYFLAIIGQDTIHIVRSVALWHIGEFRTHIAHRALLIYHVVYLQVRRYRQLILGLYHVEVTIHDTRNIRHIWNHTQHLVEIKLAHADGDILQCIFVVIVGINTHTHTARTFQHQVGRYTAIVSQHQIVILIGCKFLVSQHRMRIYQGKLHTVRLQHGSQTHIHTQAVVGIIDTCLQVGSQILHLSIHQGTEHILRIIPVVLYASRVADSIRLGMNRGTDGIYLHAARHQRIDVEIALESGCRRRIEVHLHRLEVVSHILDEARDEVILSRSEIDMTKRKTVSNLHLVYMMVLELGNQFFLQTHHLS